MTDQNKPSNENVDLTEKWEYDFWLGFTLGAVLGAFVAVLLTIFS